MASNLELHNVVKSCARRGDYLRIYSNVLKGTAWQRVKLSDLRKDPDVEVLKKYLKRCGFQHVTAEVTGISCRSLVVYAIPGATLYQSKTPPDIFKSAVGKASQEPKKMSPEEAFNAQRPLTKKEVMELKPGTWVELKWRDSENTVVLLLERPENSSSWLCYYDPDFELVARHAVHSQIVKVVGNLHVPNKNGSRLGLEV
jgi:hypothetical protein